MVFTRVNCPNRQKMAVTGKSIKYLNFYLKDVPSDCAGKSGVPEDTKEFFSYRHYLIRENS